MKKLLLTATTFTLLLGAAGIASADTIDHRRRNDSWGDRDRDRDRDHERGVIASERATGRRGMLTFAIDRRDRRADLQLVTSDARIMIRRIEVTYANGRTALLVPRRGTTTVDLGQRRIESVTVHYVNRGRAHDGTIAIVARR